MAALRKISSKTVVIPHPDIDTDQIIPARFLTTTSRDGLGRHVFSDWRFDPGGVPRADFILNRPEAAGCRVLVAGHNFGCGSSREHAPWALLDFGFQAVISTAIADIFRSNALKNGLIPVEVDEATHQWLCGRPGIEVEIDLEACELRRPDGKRVSFPIEPFSRYCLLEGIDAMGYLLAREEAITAYEASLS